MTRLSRKCVWAIVLVALAAATFIFFAWATSGFKNLDAATWFDYWGKGKPSKLVKIVEKPAERQAMALLSSDSADDVEDTTPEFILESEDGITTLAISKLPTPQLSIDYDNMVLRVKVTGTVGDVALFWTTWDDTTYSGNHQFLTLASSKFTGTAPAVSEVPFTQILNVLKTPAGQPANTCDEVGAPCFSLFAVNAKTNYLSSDYSQMLCVSYISPNFSLASEFTDGYYCLNAPKNSFLLGHNVCDFKVCSNTDPDASALVVIRPGDTSTASNNYINASFSSNYWRVNLLELSNKLSTQPSSDVYHIIFRYKPLTKTIASRPYTFYPLTMFLEKTDSFIVTRLSTPTNFNFNEGKLTWDSVAGATQYGVFWTEGETEMKAFVNTPSYTFDIQALGEGEHTVRVRALGNMAQTAVENGQTMSITAYNAANVVTQVVALTYNVDGDIVTKFVPYGSRVSDYIYDVIIKGREFGGWFYDSGYSRKVEKSDVLNGDTTIYARLSDKKVTDRPLTWWEQHMWQVLGPIIAFGGLFVIAGVVFVIRKKKKA